MTKINRIYLSLALVAVLAVTLSWIFVRFIKRTPAPPAQAQPITTTTAELGSTTTYQGITFRVYPSEQQSGKDVTLSWVVPNAEKVTVLGHEVPAYGSMTTRAPAIYTLKATGPDGSNTSAVADFTTYELEAVLKGSTELIKLKAKLMLLPTRERE